MDIKMGLSKYSRTPVTRTLKGNEKLFELSRSIEKFNLPCWKLIVADSSETVTRLGMFTIKRDLLASLIKIQIASIVTNVSFSVFTLYNKKSLWDGIRVELKEPEFELSG